MQEPQKPDPLEGLSQDKLKAVLQSLEAEKVKRREECIKAGKAIALSVMAVVGKRGEEREVLEAAKAKVLARHLAEHPEDRGKAVEWQSLIIITGVRRVKDFGD